MARTLAWRDWVKSRGPFGFWLSVAVTVLASAHVSAIASFDAAASSGVAFGSVSAVMAAGAGMLAILHHPKGWLAVRIFAFVNAGLYGVLFLVNLLTRRPDEGAWYVIALAVATVSCLAVFQYFRRPAIEALFPDPTLSSRRHRR